MDAPVVYVVPIKTKIEPHWLRQGPLDLGKIGLMTHTKETTPCRLVKIKVRMLHFLRCAIVLLSILVFTTGFKVKGFESLKPYSKKSGLSDCKIGPEAMKCYGKGTIAGVQADIEAYYWPSASHKFVLAGVIFDMDPYYWEHLIHTLEIKYGLGVISDSSWIWEDANDVIEARRGPNLKGKMWLHYFDKRKFDLRDELKSPIRKEPLEDF